MGGIVASSVGGLEMPRTTAKKTYLLKTIERAALQFFC
jgi:hypothetical protein